MSKKITKDQSNNHRGQVALPFDENQFKDFIVSLLGKQQTITKEIPGNFEFTREDVISLHELMEQRILQQNEAKLIQFRTTVNYDDSTSVTLSGYDHLVNYNEKLPVISTSIHLTWQYLIKFRDKEKFEIQEINISLIGKHAGNISFDDSYNGYIPGANEIFIRIKHTARTWGADIENLLSKHLQSYVQKENKFLSFFRYNTENVENLMFFILFSTTFIFSIFWSINADLEGNTYKLINHYAKIGSLFFITLLVFKITITILYEIEGYRKPSFILLTKQSYEDKIKRLNKYKKGWYKYFITLIISIILNIISSIIYSKYFL